MVSVFILQKGADAGLLHRTHIGFYGAYSGRLYTTCEASLLFRDFFRCRLNGVKGTQPITATTVRSMCVLAAIAAGAILIVAVPVLLVEGSHRYRLWRSGAIVKTVGATPTPVALHNPIIL